MEFKNILNNAKSIINIAGKKTGIAVEASKLRLTVLQKKSMLQSTFERIGSLYYLQEKKGTLGDNSLMKICIEEVDTLSKEIEELNAKLGQLIKGIECSHCGTKNPADATACTFCGQIIE